jgi:hypothetical protein
MTFEVSKDDVSLFYRNKESNGVLGSKFKW